MNVVLPLASGLLSLVFALLVLDQWRQRRRPFQLVWAFGLCSYGIGASTEFIGSAFGWNAGLYRAWYLFGAIYTAAWLGLGTIYLLSKTRFGYFAGVTVALGGVVSLLLTRSYPGSFGVGLTAFVVALLGGAAIIAATAVRPGWAAHLALGVLVIGSLAAAGLVLGARLSGAGFALDPVPSTSRARSAWSSAPASPPMSTCRSGSCSPREGCGRRCSPSCGTSRP